MPSRQAIEQAEITVRAASEAARIAQQERIPTLEIAGEKTREKRRVARDLATKRAHITRKRVDEVERLETELVVRTR